MPDLFDDTFARLTGNSPYGYQRRMARHLCDGVHDVLLTAPTGCGKTWATLAPFLHARQVGRPFADRVIYALPLRALAASLKEQVARVMDKLELDVRVTIQTGSQSEDETFEGDIIFTTIDQILSSYLHMPLSLPQRLGNINAGALVGALVVFDEVHLLEPEVAMRTVVHLIDSHRDLTRFVLATATLTTPARQKLLSDGAGRVLEEGPQHNEIASIAVLAQKQRSWTRVEAPLSANDVLARHAGGRTLVVVNSVGKAQDVGEKLLAEPPPGTVILVLHSRMFPDDRDAVERRLAGLFGPDASPANANVILVATQVVEAGLDLSADLLLTELAPVNALVQRAGRCARYKAPRHRGDVLVYDLERTDAGQRKLGPYRSAEQRDCIERTWRALEGAGELVLDHGEERALLDDGLADIEKATFDRLLGPASRRECRESIEEAWRTGDPAKIRELVRDVRAVAVLLSDDPEHGIDLARSPVSLSLPQPTWRGFVAGLAARGALSQVRALVDDELDDESPRSRKWRWQPLSKPGDFAQVYGLSSDLASYDAQLGLRLVPSSSLLPPIRYRVRIVGPRPHYKRETYADHVDRILRQAREWLARHPVGVNRSATRYGISPELVRDALLLAAGLHDVAKLSEAWQGAAYAWQEDKERIAGRARTPPGVPLAHTDFDPQHDRDFRRPNHAVEGAMAVLPLVEAWLGDLGCADEKVGVVRRVILTSIARHHSVRASNVRESFRLPSTARAEILAPLVRNGVAAPREPDLFESKSPDVEKAFKEHALLDVSDAHVAYWPLYGFVVRGLRLSDQAATKEGAAT